VDAQATATEESDREVAAVVLPFEKRLPKPMRRSRTAQGRQSRARTCASVMPMSIFPMPLPGRMRVSALAAAPAASAAATPAEVGCVAEERV
jgi:hypothetical protein